jgi:hypothetical protein
MNPSVFLDTRPVTAHWSHHALDHAVDNATRHSSAQGKPSAWDSIAEEDKANQVPYEDTANDFAAVVNITSAGPLELEFLGFEGEWGREMHPSAQTSEELTLAVGAEDWDQSAQGLGERFLHLSLRRP